MTVLQSALYHTTSTVIQTRDLVLVVDPNWLPNEVDEVHRFATDIRNGRPLYLLFTHSDWDHIIGYGAFEDAITIGSEAFANNPEPEMPLEQIRDFDSKYYIRRRYAPAYPKLDITVREDGQRLVVGETTLTFYLAPGHSACGVFTVVEPSGIWVAGDYLSDLEFPYVYDSTRAYMETLDKVNVILENHEIRWMVPGHGNVADSGVEIRRRQQFSRQYLLDLRTNVLSRNQAELDQMLTGVPFPRGMRMFHEENQAQVRRELEARKHS